jgi:hypothetical protein
MEHIFEQNSWFCCWIVKVKNTKIELTHIAIHLDLLALVGIFFYWMLILANYKRIILALKGHELLCFLHKKSLSFTECIRLLPLLLMERLKLLLFLDDIFFLHFFLIYLELAFRWNHINICFNI